MRLSNLLVTLPTFAATIFALPQPIQTAFEQPKRAELQPAATPAFPQSYPTTLTSVSTTVYSSTNRPLYPAFYEARYTTWLTVTLYEPWPASPTLFPYTMVQTAISKRTVDYRMTLRSGEGEATHTLDSVTWTQSSTWVLNHPSATDLSAEPAAYEPEERCEANGLDTAC